MNPEYRFRIEGDYTPKTLPMERLAEYVAAFAKFLGERDNVHLQAIEPGSAVLVAVVDAPAEPKVRDRVTAVRDGRGPTDAEKAFAELDDMLRKDNATGALSDAKDEVVVPFPGRDRPEPVVFGPFRQDGTIDGQVIRVGGRDETVHVHLRDGPVIHTSLYCTPELARRIALHFMGPALRFHGTASWLRTATGEWELRSFKITDFEILDDTPLLTVVENLRAVKGSEWREVPDPVREILAGRHGEESAH